MEWTCDFWFTWFKLHGVNETEEINSGPKFDGYDGSTTADRSKWEFPPGFGWFWSLGSLPTAGHKAAKTDAARSGVLLLPGRILMEHMGHITSCWVSSFSSYSYQKKLTAY